MQAGPPWTTGTRVHDFSTSNMAAGRVTTQLYLHFDNRKSRQKLSRGTAKVSGGRMVYTEVKGGTYGRSNRMKLAELAAKVERLRWSCFFVAEKESLTERS
jgi:hypothetical protein